jgi:hypothetical protein
MSSLSRSDLSKAVIYKLIVDIPIIMLISWLWFGHPRDHVLYVVVSTAVGTLLLYMFEKYWRILNKIHISLPIAIAWVVAIAAAYAYMWNYK